MSAQPLDHAMLQFDLSDRLRKSLHAAEIGVQEMADYLDVSRNTVSRWVNGDREPKLSTLRLWALRTGAPLDWLTTGEIKQQTPPSGDGGVLSEPPAGIEPATFSLQLVHFDQESIAA